MISNQVMPFAEDFPPKKETETAKRAYLYIYKEPIPIILLKDLESCNEVSSVKLPTTDKQGSYKWNSNIVYLPTPKLTSEEIRFLVFDRNEEENSRLQKLASSFQAVGSVSTKINRALKSGATTRAGVYEVLKEFKTYHAELLKAYVTSGFRNRKDYFAKLQLIVNLFKRFSVQEFEGIKSSAEGQDQALISFFEIQPWTIPCERLRLSLLDLSSKGVNAGHLVSLRNGVQSNDLDEPSLIIPLSSFLSLSKESIYNRVVAWLKEGDTDFHMVKIVTDFSEVTSAQVQSMIPNLTAFLIELSHNKVELLSFLGTAKLGTFSLVSTPKLLDVFLKYLVENDKLLSSLQKLDISENYISYSTFKLLADIVSRSKSLIDLNISDLRLGERAEIVVETISPEITDPPCCFCCLKPCVPVGRCSCFFLLCCTPIHCLPTNPQVDYKEVHEAVMKHTKEAVEKSRAQVSSVTDTFVAFIESLEKRGASGINGRLHSFIGRSLDFNGLGIDTSLVERLFIAVARCNPFSVSFSNASLTDKHLIAMGKMISENPSLLHYNLDGTVLVSLESWNYLQKLTSSSALIVSLPLPRTKGADVTTYLNIQEPILESIVKKEKIDCWCCKEIRYDLLLKQPMEKVGAMFTSTKESETSTDVVCEAIRTELCEHRLLPYNKVFSQLFGVDPKKLRLLRDMMQEEEFTSIFAQKIEQEKEAAFTRFKTSIKAKAQEENLSISGMDINTSVVLDYNEIWKIDEGWDEASMNGSLNQTKASFTLPNNL